MPNSSRRSPEDFAAEIRSHLELETDDLKAEGMSEKEAHRRARATFGSRAAAQERFYLRSRVEWLDNLRRDLAYGVRGMARNPGFTLTVILTLALAIGANTAIFSLVNALLIKSLPYNHPEQLATTYAHYAGPETTDSGSDLDGEQWELLRDNVPSILSAISSGIASGVNLQAKTQSGLHIQYLHAGRVSAHYFDVLALHPVLGRNFSEVEDHPNGPRVALLSYSLWHTTFNSDPNILGQPITLKGEPYTIVGVLPDAPTPLNADVYTALQPSREGEGAGTNFNAIVRLRDGATWQQANSELNRAWTAIATRIAKNYPGYHASFYLVPLQKSSTEDLRPQVLVLMLAAGFILLIACANLAGLTLVRTMRRTSEIATRLALGASRWQIQRQLWIENLLLALTGGIVSIGVGYLALHSLLTLLPEHFLPIASIHLDLRVLAFTLCVSLVTSILFGMLPALTTRKIDIRSAIATRGSSGNSSFRLRQSLIAGEVALTVLLLAASGLLIRTLIHLETLPPGFSPNGVISAKASLDDARYHDHSAFDTLLANSTAAMRQIPGVQNAAVGLNLPYERPLNDSVTLNDGPFAGKSTGADEIYVTPGYFETLQIPVLAGRTFTDSDTTTSQHVVIVNQTFARKFFANQNPVGHYLNKDTRIIGLVADVITKPGFTAGAPISAEETTYIPATQVNPKLLALVHTWFQPSWIVRTSHPIEGLTEQMQHALAGADPNLPFSGFYSMSDLLATTLAIQRIEVALLSAMAGLALLLSAIGIFSLVANIVAQRTREIGIRIALGSTIRQAMLNVGSSGILASIAGLLIGLALSAMALRTMHSVLFGIGVYDPATLTAVILTLALITLLATTLPTLKIARIDPAKTLRED
ncbi:ABC transporter permease [Acidicapsa ligni]|uniref:ABC transporter permease n=1 Tax=Acidicapsa ligni TaxID=542300 RepID=UPI0021E00328|nr:ABC transporter permease [Acidicapsa ligni]